MSRPALAFLAAATLVSSALGQDWFAAARHFPITDRGLIRQVADMDQDGDADLVWLGATTLQVWRNDGAGSFTEGPLHANGVTLSLPLPGSGHVVYPQAGDVTGDGLPDVVVGTDLTSLHAAIVVFRALGGGTFDESVTTLPNAPAPSSGSMLAVALGNVDADPVLEIATAQDTSVGLAIADVRSTVTWWNWNGSGLSAGAPLVASGPIARVFALAPIDVGDDGVADLLASGNAGSNFTGTVAILPTVAGAATLGASWPVPSATLNLTSGDVDADGDQDAIGSGGTCTETMIHAFLDQGGAIVKVDTPPIPGASCKWSPRLALGDFDGDGDLDAFENDETARPFWNDGTAHFTGGTAQTSESVAAFAFASPGCVDLDGDGFADLVASRAILFGHPAPLAPPAAPIFSFGGFAPSYVAADLEDDGDVDLVASGGILGVNSGNGHFDKVIDAWPAPPGLVTFDGPFAIGDFDGDRLLDQIVARSDGAQHVFAGMDLLVDDGTGKYADAGTITPDAIASLAGGWMRRGADADGDGDQDVPYAGGYFRNDGSSSPWPFVSAYAATETLDFADFDGDGDADALTTTTIAGTGDPTSVTVMRNDGGSWAPQLLVASSPAVGSHPRFLDLDDDGDLDVAVPMDAGSVAAKLFENVGGTFGAAIDVAAPTGATAFVGAADIDGDGLTDLVCDRAFTAVPQDGDLAIFRRAGPGLAYEPGRYWIGKAVEAIADVDADGDLDALGPLLLRSRRFEGAAAGLVLQYGAAKAGTGGAKPVLGASGPVRPGSNTASLHLRRAVGNGQAFLMVSAAGPASLGGFIPGATFLVKPPAYLVGPIPLTGAQNAAAKGTLDVDVTPFLSKVAGITVWHQIVVADPGAPGGVATSNGLAIAFGF